MPLTTLTSETQDLTELDLVPKPIRDYLRKTLNFSKTRTVNVYTALGARTIELIQENPYVIMRARSIAFVMADRFAQGAPFYIEDGDPRRLKAAVESGFNDIEESEGHTYTSRDDVIKKSFNASKVNPKLIDSWISQMLADGTIVGEIRDGVEILGLPNTWALEKWAGAWLREDLPGVNVTPVDLSEQLDDDQKEAVLSALTNRVTVITGGPGRGKTFVIEEITKQYAQANITFALMAPTGRAAARMAEMTGYPASTIHKYVLARRFPKRDEWGAAEEIVDPDVIIVDESSMMTIHLLGWILEDFDGALVIVGDADQLPSIGAGQVLHDVIASGEVPVVELKTNHRSADVLGISAAADRVLNGVIPPQGAGFAWVEQVPDTVFSVMSVYKHYGEELRGTPALAYTNAEVADLNDQLRALYNPQGAEYMLTLSKDSERLFRVGDPVMNTKNNYDLSIMNGETGIVREVYPKRNQILCEFNGEEILFDKTTMRELVPAYAFTVHKAQGMEYPIVVVAVKKISSWQKWVGRSWLYTAITRARKAAILVGDTKSVANVCKVADRGSRRTRLQEALKAA
jgi:exodeoxyribonuclease V alpha subunit